MGHPAESLQDQVPEVLIETPKVPLRTLLKQNPYVLGLACFASLGGFLFGYDQGVVSGVITMESFGAAYPRIYADSSFKGWFVSTLLLAAWFGSLINAPIADKLGRKRSILLSCVIFIVGSAIQAGAVNTVMIFTGRGIAGLAVGMLTMIIPMYMAEVSVPGLRGTLVVLQQLNITFGILISYWLEYGTHYIGGIRCAPDIAYTGGSSSERVFDPYTDVPKGGCNGQSDASWRIPFAIQILPALVLTIGMLFFPESPRWSIMAGRNESAAAALAHIRRLPQHDVNIQRELLAIKVEVQFEHAYNQEKYGGKTGFALAMSQYAALVSKWSDFRRMYVGCCTMFFQQFMGCNAMIYYAPTIFTQLGLNGNTSSLLATGVYGIVNTLATIPALLLIDKVGRRPLLMSGALGTGISLIIVGGIVGGFGTRLVSEKAAGWAGIAFLYIYDVNFSYSFAPIGWVLPSEIFNLGNRSKAISITTSTTWMCNFIIGLVTPMMFDAIGYGTYIFFAAFCFLALLFTFFFVPETRGKTLEDMDLVFGDNSAHEEKMKLFAIATRLQREEEGSLNGGDEKKVAEVKYEHV